MNLGTSPYPDPPQAADNDIPPSRRPNWNAKTN